jgi:hypothetical protein
VPGNATRRRGHRWGLAFLFMQATTDEQTPTQRNPLRTRQSDASDAATRRYWEAIKRNTMAAPPANDIPAEDRDTIRGVLRPTANPAGIPRTLT